MRQIRHEGYSYLKMSWFHPETCQYLKYNLWIVFVQVFFIQSWFQRCLLTRSPVHTVFSSFTELCILGARISEGFSHYLSHSISGHFILHFIPPHPSLHPVSHHIYHAPANSIILAGMNTMLYFIPTIHLDNPYTNSFVILTIRQSKTVRSWILKQCVGLSKPRPQQ